MDRDKPELRTSRQMPIQKPCLLEAISDNEAAGLEKFAEESLSDSGRDF
jgi:hypothetical protein